MPLAGDLRISDLESGAVGNLNSLAYFAADVGNNHIAYKYPYSVLSEALAKQGYLAEYLNQIKTLARLFVGYIGVTDPSTVIPVASIPNDALWKNTGGVPDTLFPWNGLKRWDGMAWINYANSYTPTLWDTWHVIDDDTNYFWNSQSWQIDDVSGDGVNISANLAGKLYLIDNSIAIGKLQTAVQDMITGALQRSGGVMTGALSVLEAMDADSPAQRGQVEKMYAGLFKYAGLKAAIEAYPGTQDGDTALAIDTDETGAYTIGTGWTWTATGNKLKGYFFKTTIFISGSDVYEALGFWNGTGYDMVPLHDAALLAAVWLGITSLQAEKADKVPVSEDRTLAQIHPGQIPGTITFNTAMIMEPPESPESITFSDGSALDVSLEGILLYRDAGGAGTVIYDGTAWIQEQIVIDRAVSAITPLTAGVWSAGIWTLTVDQNLFDVRELTLDAMEAAGNAQGTADAALPRADVVDDLTTGGSAKALSAEQGKVEATVRAAADSALGARIDGLETLGHYVGSFDTFADLPENKSAFPNGITINDFTTVRNDETHDSGITRYVVIAIDADTGAITWNFDFVITVDVTGKADKVVNVIAGHLAGLTADGNLVDSGVAADDIQVQADWDMTDTTDPSFIKNKPTNSALHSTDVYGLNVEWVKNGKTVGLFITGAITGPLDDGEEITVDLPVPALPTFAHLYGNNYNVKPNSMFYIIGGGLMYRGMALPPSTDVMCSITYLEA